MHPSSDSLEEERSFKWEYVYEVSRKNTIRRGQLYTDEHPCPTKHNVPREIKPGVTVTYIYTASTLPFFPLTPLILIGR